MNYCCLRVILIDPTVQQLCRLPALKCYIESWGKCYCHHNISLKVLPTTLTCALHASPPYNILYRHEEWTILAESFVLSSSLILMPLSSWAIKSSWLGNMEREIDDEIAAVDHRYVAEKAKPSIVVSLSLYTPFMFMPAAVPSSANSNDCHKFMNPVSFDNIII